MSEKPQMTPHDTMMQMITGFWVSKSLGVVARLGVADQLSGGPKSAATLAEAVGADPDALFRMMRALSGIGIFSQPEPGVFALTPLSELLQTDAAGSLRWMSAAHVESAQWQPWSRAMDVVKSGRSHAREALGDLDVWAYYEKNPDQGKAFAKAMTDFSSSEIVPVCEAYDFSSLTKIVDIGGSHGGLLDAVLDKAPDAKGVLFDRPDIVEGADLSKLAHGNRIEAVGGDFMESVPEGGDAYMMKHIVHDWNDEQSTRLLKSVRKAIPDKGRLLIIEMVLSEQSPPFVAWLDFHMLTMIDGKQRTEKEFAALVKGAGFRMERIIPTKSAVSLVEAFPV